MNPESLKSTLAALRKAGSVFGVLFSEGNETLFSDLACSPDRVNDLNQVLGDIVLYFRQENRNPEHLSFAYDGGNLLLLFRNGHRLVILHHHADEADFILSAGAAFLTDYLTGKSAEELRVAREAAELPAKASSVKPAKPGGGRVVDPTAPIAPAV